MEDVKHNTALDIADGADDHSFETDDENNSECSDEEDAIDVISKGDNSTTILKSEQQSRRSTTSKRLSSKFLPMKDIGFDSQIALSAATLAAIDNLIQRFPTAPTNVPQPPEPSTPAYSQVSSAALKAVSLGFGSLRRGVDRLGLFSPKK